MKYGKNQYRFLRRGAKKPYLCPFCFARVMAKKSKAINHFKKTITKGNFPKGVVSPEKRIGLVQCWIWTFFSERDFYHSRGGGGLTIKSIKSLNFRVGFEWSGAENVSPAIPWIQHFMNEWGSYVFSILEQVQSDNPFSNRKDWPKFLFRFNTHRYIMQ